MRTIVAAVVFCTLLCGCGSGGNPTPLASSSFSVQGTSLFYQGRQMFLKGVGYSPLRPGEMQVSEGSNDPSTFSLPDDGRYSTDLNAIRRMNANYLVVFPQFMPSGFSTALSNSNLVYSQCIALDTAFHTGSSNDLLDPTFQANSLAHIGAVIDHTYTYGAPDRLVFFSVGDEINPGVIHVTDTAHPSTRSFHGRFINLTNRTPSEIAIATLMDKAMAYEQDHHGTRHLYTHTSFTWLGPVANRPDLQVVPTSVFYADFGDIVALNVYSYGHGVKTSPPGSRTGTPFQGYIEDLEKIAAKPVIITQTGLSTSPTAPDPTTPGYGGNSVDTVAAVYMQTWQDIITSNHSERIAGMAFFEYNDEWWKGGSPITHLTNQPEAWFGIYANNPDGTLVPKGNLPNVVMQLFAP